MPEQVMEESDEDDDWCEIDGRSEGIDKDQDKHMQPMNTSKGLASVKELGNMFSKMLPNQEGIRSTALPETQHPAFLELEKNRANRETMKIGKKTKSGL